MSELLFDYTAQCTEGNFAQFVYNSGWDELNELIEEALALVGAEKHLELFNNNPKRTG
jgi:hypothetical protein